MKKTILLLSALMIFPLSAQAHSVLESSTPTEGEVVTEPIEQIALDFSAGIEEGSTMSMTVDGMAVDFSEVAVADDQLIGTPAQLLLDGTYTVAYDVLSEDGHPIEGTLVFEMQAGVAAEAENEAAAEESAAEQAAEMEAEEAATEEPEAAKEQAAGEQAAASESSGPVMTWVLAGIALLLLVGAVVLMRKKR